MHRDDARISGSVATIEFEAVGARTRDEIDARPTPDKDAVPARKPQAGTALPPRVRRQPNYGLASSTRLNGVSVARRKRVNPPSVITSRSRDSPAWAPSARPTSWSREAGVHTSVEAP
jgi:hypothetical protein